MSVQFIEPPDRYYFDDHSDRDDDIPEGDPFDDADRAYDHMREQEMR